MNEADRVGATANPVHWNALVAVHRDGAADMLTTLMPMFRAMLKETLAHLRASLDANDLPAVVDAAHGLRGSAAMIGATALCDAAAQIDTADLTLPCASSGVRAVERQAARFVDFDEADFVRCNT